MAIDATAPSASDPVCAIWNPSAAAIWSLVFTPAFGVFIHMLNWQAPGQLQQAARAPLVLCQAVAADTAGVHARALRPDRQ